MAGPASSSTVTVSAMNTRGQAVVVVDRADRGAVVDGRRWWGCPTDTRNRSSASETPSGSVATSTRAVVVPGARRQRARRGAVVGAGGGRAHPRRQRLGGPRHRDGAAADRGEAHLEADRGTLRGAGVADADLRAAGRPSTMAPVAVPPTMVAPTGPARRSQNVLGVLVEGVVQQRHRDGGLGGARREAQHARHLPCSPGPGWRPPRRPRRDRQRVAYSTVTSWVDGPAQSERERRGRPLDPGRGVGHRHRRQAVVVDRPAPTPRRRPTRRCCSAS